LVFVTLCATKTIKMKLGIVILLIIVIGMNENLLSQSIFAAIQNNDIDLIKKLTKKNSSLDTINPVYMEHL